MTGSHIAGAALPGAAADPLLTLEQRIARIEATQATQQLAVRYALALDSRDLRAWAALFVEDVDCGARGRGRDVLRGIVARSVRRFYRSIHQICGHRVQLLTPDTATGQVYCRAEHEAGGEWVVMTILYADDYRRDAGEWLFVRRRERFWYASDLLRRPAPPFKDWEVPSGKATLPERFDTWAGFWADVPEEEIAALTPLPIAAGR